MQNLHSSAEPPGHHLERLAEVCGRLRSEHDGERAAAAVVTARLLRDRGLAWEDVALRRSTAAAAPGCEHSGGLALGHRVHAPWAPQRTRASTLWERDPLLGIARRSTARTAKQGAVLDGICVPLRARTGAGGPA